MKQIKYTILLLALVTSLLPAKAGDFDSTVVKYRVDYVTEHKLLQRAGETTVVDINLEWPTVIDGQQCDSLKRFIAHRLFDVEANALQPALHLLYNKYGEEVKGQFQEIPDDSKFCYVNLSLSLLSHEEGRFTSFHLLRTVTPEKNSTVKSDTTELLLTYDMQQGAVLMQQDLIRTSRITNSIGGYHFITALVKAFPDGVPDEIQSMALKESCLVGDKVLCYVIFDNQEGSFFQPAMVNGNEVKRFLTKRATQLLEPQSTIVGSIVMSNDETVDGEKVVLAPDVLPEYPGGKDSLNVFLARHMDKEPFVNDRHKVLRSLVSMIIDKNGHPRNFAIINTPCSPEYDRECVRVMRMMSTWKPATVAGKPVPMRMAIPVSLQIGY